MGRFVVVLARFVYGLRQLNGIVAGIGRMPALWFVLYNALGAALWVGVWGLGVYFFGNQVTYLIQSLAAAINPLGILALAGLAVGALAGFFWWRRRHASQTG